jgi:3-phytase
MLLPRSLIVGLVFCLSGIDIASAATANLPISKQSAEVDSDLAAIYYGSSFQDSLLVGNDGGAATGGVRSFSLTDMEEVASRTPGRTKVVGVMYDVGKKDLIVSIAAPDSIIRVFDIDGTTEIPSAQIKALGDWSSLCTWRSPSSGGHYFYLLGKKEARQFLVREKDSDIEILEVSIPATHSAILWNLKEIFRSKDLKFPYQLLVLFLLPVVLSIWRVRTRAFTPSRPRNQPPPPRSRPWERLMTM